LAQISLKAFLCGALNHQNLIEMAQGHISLSASPATFAAPTHAQTVRPLGREPKPLYQVADCPTPGRGPYAPLQRAPPPVLVIVIGAQKGVYSVTAPCASGGVTPGFKGQSPVHLIYAPKKTTHIITKCIEINVTISLEYLLHSGSLTK
jgi:hypothetical protein